MLLKRWCFSEIYVNVALRHHLDEIDSSSRELMVIHFANILVRAMGYGLDDPGYEDLSAVPSAQELGLNSDMIAHVQKTVTQRMEELKHYLD